MQGISFWVEPDPEWVRTDKRLLARATPRVRLICDCLEETILAEASPYANTGAPPPELDGKIDPRDPLYRFLLKFPQLRDADELRWDDQKG